MRRYQNSCDSAQKMAALSNVYPLKMYINPVEKVEANYLSKEQIESHGNDILSSKTGFLEHKLKSGKEKHFYYLGVFTSEETAAAAHESVYEMDYTVRGQHRL